MKKVLRLFNNVSRVLCRNKKQNEFIDDIREFDRQFVYLFNSIFTLIYINNKSIFRFGK